MPISNIRIVDPHILRLVEEEQRRTGEKTPTKTAQRMIVERAAQKELVSRGRVEDFSPEVATATSAA
jgi:hypothetical protein